MALAVAAHDRATGLGFSVREYIAFAGAFPELFARPICDSLWALARIGRWHRAGRPKPDFRRLVVMGASSFRVVLTETLKKLPDAIAWHAVEWIAWFETGRTAGGYQAIAPVMRVPLADSPHIVVMCGSQRDDRTMPQAIVHEVGHSMDRMFIERDDDDAERIRPTADELAVSHLKLHHDDVLTAARADLERELFADEFARALGFPPSGHSSDAHRLHGLIAELEAARDRNVMQARIAAINTGDTQ